MRVFVLGTGRCGSATFAAACSHITNYTSAHESKAQQWNDLDYPDNHIEIDCHLSWHIHLLASRYPEAKYLLLRRNAKDCIRSLEKRPTMKAVCRILDAPWNTSIHAAAEWYYHYVNMIVKETLFGRDVDFAEMTIDGVGPAEWDFFLGWIGAKTGERTGIHEFKNHRNKGDAA